MVVDKYCVLKIIFLYWHNPRRVQIFYILSGDFGGTMGLWLGASILAAVQLLDYLITRCAAKTCKNVKTKEATKDVIITWH